MKLKANKAIPSTYITDFLQDVLLLQVRVCFYHVLFVNDEQTSKPV